MSIRSSIAIVAILGIAACGGETQTAAPPAPPPPTTGSTTAEAPTPPAPTPTGDQTPPAPPKAPLADLEKKTMTEFVAAMNAHDWARWGQTLTADVKVVGIGPKGPETITSRDEMVKHHQAMAAAFPDMTVGVSRNFQKGDVVVSEWVMTGTNTGDFMGKKPTKKKVGVHGVTVLWFNDDGLVKEAHPYIDDSTIMMQLGLAPGKRELATLPTGDAQWIASTGSADEQKALDAMKASWPVSWSKRDPKMYGDQITDDCVHVDYGLGTEFKGKKANVGELEMFVKAMPEIKVDVPNAWAFGNVVVSEWVFSGTLKGSLGPLKANGKPISVHGLDIDEMQGDKLAKGYSYDNSLEVMGELGMLPKQK